MVQGIAPKTTKRCAGYLLDFNSSAALCQVYDSIFRTRSETKTAFHADANAKRGSAHAEGQIQRQHGVCLHSEFQDITEWVAFPGCTSESKGDLADAFTRHGIERNVPIEALVKCKMQDNLEFLQWSKRYWDQYYPGGDYDALSRRKSAGPVAAASTPAPRASAGGAARRGTTPTTGAAARSTRPLGGGGGGGASAAVVSENNQLKETVGGLERERDFYFAKLRDIEILIQAAVDADPEIEKEESGLIKQIQAILYSTEVSGQMAQKELEADENFEGGFRDTRRCGRRG